MANQDVAGAVAVLVSRGEVVHLQASGFANRDSETTMSSDSMFRLASLTKPVISVAVLRLLDQGKLSLDDHVSTYLPVFANPKVLVDGGPSATAKSPITIGQLLTHTSGIAGLAHRVLGPRFSKAGLHAMYTNDMSLSEAVDTLAQFPLVCHPGEAFEYGLSTDVLGRVIEVVSGEDLELFLQRKVFGPLQMNDTQFFIPEDKMGRLAVVYERTGSGNLARIPNGLLTRHINRPDLGFDFDLTFSVDYPYTEPRRLFSAVGGLCSTPADYIRFCQMVVDCGESDGVQLLHPETVKLMGTNQIGDSQVPDALGGGKFGLGFMVVENPNDPLNGGLYWSGVFGTSCWILPQSESFLVFMTQVSPTSKPNVLDLSPRVRELAAKVLPAHP